MASPNPPRSKDDTIVAFLHRRQKGWTVYQIAHRFDCSPSYVDKTTRAVRAADLAESGEDAAVVDAAYWRARQQRVA